MTETVRIEQSIEKPDLDNLDPWLERYITEPFVGMEDKKHPDGTPFTKEDALEASKEQLRMVVRDRDETLAFHNRNRAIKNLPLLLKEQNDQSLTEDFIAIAEGK